MNGGFFSRIGESVKKQDPPWVPASDDFAFGDGVR